MTITSLESCYRIADETEHDAERAAINFAAYTAQMYRRFSKELAWACKQKNSAKRLEALNKVLLEMQGNDESTADFPMRTVQS